MLCVLLLFPCSLPNRYIRTHGDDLRHRCFFIRFDAYHSLEVTCPTSVPEGMKRALSFGLRESAVQTPCDVGLARSITQSNQRLGLECPQRLGVRFPVRLSMRPSSAWCLWTVGVTTDELISRRCGRVAFPERPGCPEVQQGIQLQTDGAYQKYLYGSTLPSQLRISLKRSAINAPG